MRKRFIPIREYFLLNISSVIRFLTLSEIVWGGARGLLGPIFAIFIVDYIQGGNAAVIGTAAAIFLITKSVFQMPAATIIDRIRGEKDDFWIMFGASVLSALVPLLYLIINTPMELYLVEFVYGVLFAITVPSYMAIFTRHIDHQKEGTEWGVYFTLTDLSSALTAAIGGAIAITVGFPQLIVAVVVVSVIGALFLLPIRPYMRMPSKHP
ncbi:MAG: MFS transporter [Patescibacteria group bacterium]